MTQKKKWYSKVRGVMREGDGRRRDGGWSPYLRLTNGKRYH